MATNGKKTSTAVPLEKRRAKHRQSLVNAGGRAFTIELDAVAISALDFVKKRDKIKTNKQVVQESLLLNAKGSK